MFLTTEPILIGKNYNALRVVFAAVTVNEGYKANIPNMAIEGALKQIYDNAANIGADGVIGVHINISVDSTTFYATVMGTAIKFS